MYSAEFDVVAASELSSIQRMTGYFFEETATIPGSARVELRDGSVAGPLLDVVILAGDGYVSRNFSVPIETTSSIYVRVVSGTVVGCVYGEK